MLTGGAELLLIALVGAAVLIGITGAWSPCGLSMVETIGPTGHTGSRPVTVAALATFLPGALLGGALTFGALGALGALIHGAGAGGGSLAYVIAAVIAVAAALAEARGLPIVPQIRRQLPEHWRRVMPMPAAAGLYGVLLGLGFTTFVLSFGVWALAGISFALADAWAGVLIGLAFGLGRALPILALAPICDRPSGRRATEAMTQNPAIYRRVRAGDAAALGIVAAALIAIGPAAGANRVAEQGAGDPSVSGGDLVFQRAQGAVGLAQGERLGLSGAGLLRGGQRVPLEGSVPALGGGYLALRRGDDLVVLNQADLAELGRVAAPDTDAIAISDRWLVERAREAGGDRLQVRRIGSAEAGFMIGQARVVGRSASPAQLGRPSIRGNHLLITRSGPRASRLQLLSLANGTARNLIGARLAAFASPAALGDRFAYVRTTRERQEIRIRALGGRGLGRLIHARPATSLRDPDHAPGRNRIPTMDRPPRLERDRWAIWNIDLAPRAVFATLIRQAEGRPRARILRFPR